MKLSAVDRRTLLIGGGAAVGLVVAFLAWPRRETSPLRGTARDKAVNAYLRIGTDGRVTLASPQTEVGQGIWTALAQIAADELGARWEDLAVEPAPTAPVYSNELFGKEFGVTTRITAAGTSVRGFEAPVREAAATARQLLCMAAAARWGVSADECDTSDSAAMHEGKRLPFAELAEAAATMVTAPGRVALRNIGAGAISGGEQARVDLPAKTDGTWRFAGDVRLPGMLFASVRMAPPGGRLKALRGKPKPGAKLVQRDDWVGAIADTWWAADRALSQCNPLFEGPQLGGEAIEERLAKKLAAGPFERLFDSGDYDAAVAGSRPLAATYWIGPTPHHSLEPPAAVARWSSDRVEVWSGCQAPNLAHAVAARAAGIPEEKVTLYPMPVGDGSGRAVDAEAVAMAVDLAREAGKPVCLTIPPDVAANQDPVRPPLAVKLAALSRPDGTLASWHALLAGMPGIEASLAREQGNEVPPYRPRGAVPPYGIGAIRVAAARADLPIRTGYMRGGDETMLCFATESFIDEMARLFHSDPLAIRMAMLGGTPRLARALNQVATIGGWDGGPTGSAMGLACASLQGSHIALLVEASIGINQRIQVSRMVAAVDCGRTINPGLVRQQVEGGMLAGLAAATVTIPDYVAAMPRAVPMASQPFERLSDVPAITVEIIESSEEPGGVSGLGMAVVAPAVANAIAAGSGRRLRRLPFDLMAD